MSTSNITVYNNKRPPPSHLPLNVVTRSGSCTVSWSWSPWTSRPSTRGAAAATPVSWPPAASPGGPGSSPGTS